jgi:prenyl protein peptidase
MLPILLGYYTTSGAVIMSPFFFGIAHFHHMIERIRRGQDIQTAFFISSFQFAYTTMFGMYSALLFVRTGHLASCVVVHGFCNFMGFPDLVELVHQEPKKRLIGMLKALTQQFVLWSRNLSRRSNVSINHSL